MSSASSLPTLPAFPLPADSHVHSQFSWDTDAGDMAATCERALAIGLPAVAFTEHVDSSSWSVQPADLEGRDHFRPLVTDGVLTPPPLDVAAYLACVEECRARFPGLRILTGVEVGEPHWNAEPAASMLAGRSFERVLGSLHGLRIDGRFREMPELAAMFPGDELLRRYLAEVVVLARSDAPFESLAHLDYPLRRPSFTSFDPAPLAEEFRAALQALAASGRFLEINTRLTLHPQLVRWWHEVGGSAVTFGSDAHRPDAVGRGFAEAAALARACGFRPGRAVGDPWGRA